MSYLKVIHKKSGHAFASKVKVARNTFSRMKGLMFADEMSDFDGLIIERCNSIHTFFMKFPIDVVFLNSENKVIKIFRGLDPWKMTGLYFKASKVLELNAGSLPNDIEEDDHLEVICIN